MTILETFIKLRDDLKTWVTNNLNQKANISYVDEKFNSISEFDPTEIQKAINENTSAIDANEEEIKGLSERLDGVEGDINTITNTTINNLSEEFEKYKATNDNVVSANTSAIAILNGEGDGSVKKSIDDAFTELVGEVDDINARVDEIDENFSTYKTTIQDALENHNHDDLYYDKDEILGLITVEDIDDICESNISSGEDIDVVSVATKYWVEQFYQPKGSYITETDINNHNVSESSHNDIRLEIEDLKDAFETFIECDDETLKQIQDIVDYINDNDSIITGITNKKVNISDIIDNLETNVSNKPLSAAQGVILKSLIEALRTEINGKIVGTDKLLSTSDAPADAKVVGDALSELNTTIATKIDAPESVEVGQVLAVKSVDENGQIAWETVNQEAADVSVAEQFSVELGANGTIGGYKTGDVIAEGTSVVTIINKLLRKAIPATYTNPKVTLAAQNTAAGSHEYGTNITAQVKATFTKNDAGAMQSISISKDGVEILTGTSNTLTSDAETFKLTSTVSYTASATYAEGAIKNDNLGEPSPSGHIAAGTVTSSAVTFTPYRQGYFYGVLATDKTTPLTSDIIRGCNKKGGAYAAGNLPLISASSVDNRKRIFVACPATSKGVTKVVMPSAQGADATKDFVKQSSTVTVEGANGTTGIAYNVWVYEPALISDDQTFTVTLG